jgi:hypothetical protein
MTTNFIDQIGLGIHGAFSDAGRALTAKKRQKNTEQTFKNSLIGGFGSVVREEDDCKRTFEMVPVVL